jgi:hypothetical protein
MTPGLFSLCGDCRPGLAASGWERGVCDGGVGIEDAADDGIRRQPRDMLHGVVDHLDDLFRRVGRVFRQD